MTIHEKILLTAFLAVLLGPLESRASGPWSIERFSEILKPHGGEERVLPPRVKTMVDLLRANKVETFTVSSKIAVDPLMNQRVTEGAVPAVKVAGSPNLLLLEEPLPEGCRAIGEKGGVILARCP